MAVITISRQMGSLGTEIAEEVAGKLHYEYLDREEIGQASLLKAWPFRKWKNSMKRVNPSGSIGRSRD